MFGVLVRSLTIVALYEVPGPRPIILMRGQTATSVTLARVSRRDATGQPFNGAQQNHQTITNEELVF